MAGFRLTTERKHPFHWVERINPIFGNTIYAVYPLRCHLITADKWQPWKGKTEQIKRKYCLKVALLQFELRLDKNHAKMINYWYSDNYVKFGSFRKNCIFAPEIRERLRPLHEIRLHQTNIFSLIKVNEKKIPLDWFGVAAIRIVCVVPDHVR